MGIAYQLQDDYLDTFGDDTFGKKIGGDILQNKKTLLYLKSLEKGTAEQKQELHILYTTKPKSEAEKIARVTEIFVATQSHTYLREQVEAYTLKAFAILDTLDIPKEKKEILKEFGRSLMNRTI